MQQRRAILTVDLGFGDAGKGSVVDYLTRTHQADLVVRYNGGAQAGHRVVTGDGRSHVFSQFGSGTLAGAATHLSRFMVLEPLAMQAEAAHLRSLGVADPFARTTIDRQALVITPFQRAINRLRELARGPARHGSCGLGVGESMHDFLTHGAQVLLAGDLDQPDRLRAKLAFVRAANRAKLVEILPRLPQTEQCRAELDLLLDQEWLPWLMEAYRAFTAEAQLVDGDHLHRLLDRPGTVIFEGAQGVLLDEWHGFHPHTTWSTTTLAHACTLLREAGYGGETLRLGITRAYATRHGAGPLPTEDATLTAALPDPANGFHAWQQGFRVGWPDLPLLRYAAAAVGRLDGLAVTCLDRVARLPALRLCTGYSHRGAYLAELPCSPRLRDLAYQARLTRLLAEATPCYGPPIASADAPDLLAAAVGAPPLLLSYGPTAEEKVAVGAVVTA